jgi:hypothetical protein
MVMPSSSNSGGGMGISCPLNNAGMNQVSRALLNIGWCFQDHGMLSLKADSPIFQNKEWT